MSTPASNSPVQNSPDLPSPPGESPAPEAGRRPSRGRVASSSAWWPFLVADLVLVLVFAAIGRASHGEDVSGVLVTAWPFLVGALVGWGVCRGFRSPAALWPAGVTVWLGAEVLGMVLRAVTGQGTAFSFVVVSLVVLAVFLLAYRVIVRVVRHLSHI